MVTGNRKSGGRSENWHGGCRWGEKLEKGGGSGAAVGSGYARVEGRRCDPGDVVRVQLRRGRGWRLPANTVVVARPSKWCNPFRVTPERSHILAVGAYRTWLTVDGVTAGLRARKDWILAHLGDLRGKNLACWCPLDRPCHADVLLELANPEPSADPGSVKPVICVGWPSIALLAHGKNVELDGAILIPDDLLTNTAARIGRGELSPNPKPDEDDSAYEEWMTELAETCRADCRPCPGCQQGGICDGANSKP